MAKYQFRKNLLIKKALARMICATYNKIRNGELTQKKLDAILQIGNNPSIVGIDVGSMMSTDNKIYGTQCYH